jgi:hypothetical protein
VRRVLVWHALRGALILFTGYRRSTLRCDLRLQYGNPSGSSGYNSMKLGGFLGPHSVNTFGFKLQASLSLGFDGVVT